MNDTKNEVKILTYLTRTPICPDCIKIYDYIDCAGEYIIIMELFQGFTLDNVAGKLDFPRWRHVASKLANILQSLHDHGVVHRDIKSANVMFNTTSLKLVDFGFACTIEKEPARCTYNIKGTPTNMSPEILADDNTHLQAADIWAYGITVFQLYYNRKPYPNIRTIQELKNYIKHSGPKFPVSENEDMAKVERLLRIIFTRDPDERIIAFSEFQAQLRSTL